MYVHFLEGNRMINTSAVVDVDCARAAQLADAGALLLDVREDFEWAEAHIPGSVHMPLGMLNPAAVPNGQAVVVVCRSGNRSSFAAAQLMAAGFPEVYNLAGGLIAWARDARDLEAGGAGVH